MASFSSVTKPVLPGIGVTSGVLINSGTAGNDRITMNLVAKLLQVQSPLSNSPIRSFLAADVHEIVVFGCAGNETITIWAAIKIETENYGGDGNDWRGRIRYARPR